MSFCKKNGMIQADGDSRYSKVRAELLLAGYIL